MDRVQVLDHGYVALIERWGSDERIIESARMSTAKGFLGWEPERVFKCEGTCGYTKVLRGEEAAAGNMAPICIQQIPVHCARYGMAMTEVSKHPGDMKLLRYLWEHNHATPFEMGGLTFEVQAPIFVLRQWFTHRTQSRTEMSARYTELPELAYVPSVDRLMAAGQSATNRQAGDSPLTEGVAANSVFIINECYNVAYAAYHALLAQGVASELARTVLPVGQYSRMRVSANLRNWLHFLGLRMDSHAQWEMRQFANAVGEMVAHEFPRTWSLFIEGR